MLNGISSMNISISNVSAFNSTIIAGKITTK